MEPGNPPGRAGAERPLVYDNLGSGHRANYVRLLAALVEGEGEIAPYRSRVGRLLSHPSLILSSFEGGPRQNLAIVIARMMLRRRTAVVLLRAHLTAHRRGPGRWIHAAALRLMGTSRFVLPLSIVGSDELARLCPRVQVIADPEFWDYQFGPAFAPDASLIAGIRARARGRKVVLVTGTISGDKAVGELGAMFAASPELRGAFFAVLAGPLRPEAEEECAFIKEHGWQIDGWIDDFAFRSLFGAADFAWCAYRPSRDMSSGILGRCIQSDVVPIVRSGSVAERLARKWTDPVTVDFADPAASARALLSYAGEAVPAKGDALRAEGERVGQLLRDFFRL